ncbi:MAG: hypothetical protein IPN96_22490 [Anaerolineales bacterium]|nr:hypothetical protein [Anaerolineales bacterium]
MAVLGFLVAIAGFSYALSVIWAYFVNETPFEGWAPIMILILVIGGVIMLMLGMLGEYVWRILEEVKSRPIYVIKDKFL